jgi:DNA-binding MarR family transcriptional regulator
VPTQLRPLDPAEERTWALLVGVMTWLPAALDTRLQESADVSHAEYSVLRWLSQCDGGALHMSRLADRTSVTPSHLSRIVSRLEKRGLVARTPDPGDGRYTLAQLTDAGAALVTAQDPGYAALVRELLLDRLPATEREQLEGIAGRVLTALKPECLAAHPVPVE